MRERYKTLLILTVIVLSVGGIGFAGTPVVNRVATDALIKLVVVLGLSVFIGNSGILSFGHASFASIGAYGSAWFTMPLAIKKVFLPKLPALVLATQLSLLDAILIATGSAALCALLIGSVVVQLSGVAASIATLAWLAIVNTVFANTDSLTKGTSSLVGLPLVVGVGTALVAALLSLLAAFSFRYSRFGLMLRASSEDEIAASASGISVRMLRLAAFVLSAAIVALGGALQGHFLGTLSVNLFYLDFTFITLAMLVVGGLRSLSGAVIGTIAIALVSEILRMVAEGVTVAGIAIPAAPGLRELGLAVVMLVTLIIRPHGIMGSKEL